MCLLISLEININRVIMKINQIDTLEKGDYFQLKINPDFEEIRIGSGSHTRSFCSFVIENNASLILGNNVFFNNYCSVNCLHHIEIGDDTILGEGVRIYDHDHLYTSNEISKSVFRLSPINIGKNCWIGSNVVILRGVNIGDNCIIGAGCVIYKDVPSNTVVMAKQEYIFRDRMKDE